jgi:predicted RNA-binding protein YlqC (UPF0109 family)
MNESQQDTLSLVDMLVRSLVDDPDSARVTVPEADDDGMTIEVSVAADDVGKVIGRGGRIIKAIRTIARAAASQDGYQVDVEVLG